MPKESLQPGENEPRRSAAEAIRAFVPQTNEGEPWKRNSNFVKELTEITKKGDLRWMTPPLRSEYSSLNTMAVAQAENFTVIVQKTIDTSERNYARSDYRHGEDEGRNYELRIFNNIGEAAFFTDKRAPYTEPDTKGSGYDASKESKHRTAGLDTLFQAAAKKTIEEEERIKDKRRIEVENGPVNSGAYIPNKLAKKLYDVASSRQMKEEELVVEAWQKAINLLANQTPEAQTEVIAAYEEKLKQYEDPRPERNFGSYQGWEGSRRVSYDITMSKELARSAWEIAAQNDTTFMGLTNVIVADYVTRNDTDR